MAFAFVFTYQDNHLVTDFTLARPKANDDKPITSALHQQHLLKQQTTPDPDQSLLLQNEFLQSGGAEEDRTPDLLRARQALSQLSYGPIVTWSVRPSAMVPQWDPSIPTSRPGSARDLVGLGGVEPPTSPLSGARSNHLSYRPARSRCSHPGCVLRGHYDTRRTGVGH